jgi:hypothetical protein
VGHWSLVGRPFTQKARIPGLNGCPMKSTSTTLGPELRTARVYPWAGLALTRLIVVPWHHTVTVPPVVENVAVTEVEPPDELPGFGRGGFDPPGGVGGGGGSWPPPPAQPVLPPLPDGGGGLSRTAGGAMGGGDAGGGE